MPRLMHFVAEVGEGEYIALLDDGEPVDEYREEGFDVSGAFDISPLTDGAATYTLPLGRIFKEY